MILLILPSLQSDNNHMDSASKVWQCKASVQLVYVETIS